MLLKSIGNSPLLSGLRSKYKSLILDVKGFKEKITPEDSFYYVESIPEIGVSKVKTCTLEALGKFWGPPPFQSSDLYKLKGGKRGFVEDLLNYEGSACFTDIYEANQYRNDLVSNWEDLFTPVTTK